MIYSKELGFYLNWAKSRLTKSSQIPHRCKKDFQIYEDPHELAKESGKDNKWWKDNSFILLYGLNEGR